MSLVEELLADTELEARIESLVLIPASGGKYEVMVNGQLLFSKASLKRHAEPGEIYKLIKAQSETP